MAKVLVVDDAVEITRLLAGYLHAEGHEVVVAHSGAEAMEVAAAERPDLVLLDIEMPGMDGIEVCRRLKADPRFRAVPVILVTARSEDDDVIEGLDAGADDYVSKPFKREILAARIRSAMRVKTGLDTIVRMNEHLRAEIVERGRAEAEARSLRQRIEFILGATKTGLDIIDANFNVVYVDPQWQTACGPLAGRKCYEYFRGRSSPCENCGMIEAMRTKQIVVSEQTLPKEGDRPVQVTAIPFQNDRGEWQIAEVSVDVSRSKRMERELAHAQKLEAIGQLAAGIAHEINTPTQYVSDNIRFVEEAFGEFERVRWALARLGQAAGDNTLTAELQAEAESAARAADVDYFANEVPKAIRESLEGMEHIARIVAAMSDFARPSGESKTPVDINHSIESTLTISRNEWKYVADVVTDLDAELPPVPCLPGDFHQVVLNLVVNAAQAVAEVVGEGSPDKGRITVRTRRDGDWAEIRVEDTGPGIPEDIRSRVFDQFFTTRKVGKGIGQGLSIAHRIVVQRHGGTITFETEIGKGTTFIVRLPITPASSGSGPG